MVGFTIAAVSAISLRDERCRCCSPQHRFRLESGRSGCVASSPGSCICRFRARVSDQRGGRRHRNVSGARGDRRVGWPALVHDGGAAGYHRARKPRPGALDHPKLRPRLPGAPDHREPSPRRRAHGGLVVRPPHRPRPAGNVGGLTRRVVGDIVVLGELSLDGGINSIRGVLPVAGAARRLGVPRLLVSPRNAAEACAVSGLEVFVAHSLRQAIDTLNDPARAQVAVPAARFDPAPPSETNDDLADVRGQLLPRRALEIAAAGGHNLLMVGPPGSGKMLIARRNSRRAAPADYRRGPRVHRRALGCGATPGRCRTADHVAVPGASPHDFDGSPRGRRQPATAGGGIARAATGLGHRLGRLASPSGDAIRLRETLGELWLELTALGFGTALAALAVIRACL